MIMFTKPATLGTFYHQESNLFFLSDSFSNSLQLETGVFLREKSRVWELHKISWLCGIDTNLFRLNMLIVDLMPNDIKSIDEVKNKKLLISIFSFILKFLRKLFLYPRLSNINIGTKK